MLKPNDRTITFDEVRLIGAEGDQLGVVAYAEAKRLAAEAGMDLEPYHGKRMKCYSYEVTNYPGEPNVLAHLYVYKEKIVGGDVSSTALDGFMHGLSKLG